MQITHFGHSCILVEFDGTRVLFDPGNFSHGFTGVTGLDAILITHQHPDHVDVATLPDLVAGNPEAVDADPAPGSAQRRRPCRRNVDGCPARRRVHHRWHQHQDRRRHPCRDPSGHPHHRQRRLSPRRPEYLVQLMHPGDSLFVPEEKVDVLAMPTMAPWMKISEAIDYLRAVKPRLSFPIHNALLVEAGLKMHDGRFSEMSDESTEFLVLPDQDALDVTSNFPEIVRLRGRRGKYALCTLGIGRSRGRTSGDVGEHSAADQVVDHPGDAVEHPDHHHRDDSRVAKQPSNRRGRLSACGEDAHRDHEQDRGDKTDGPEDVVREGPRESP